ncbi:MAG: patatin-like phospholipase family protein [Hyphomicrobium sp.]
MRFSSFGAVVCVVAGLFAVGGCATPAERHGIADARLAERANVAGMPTVRFWADEVPSNPIAEIRRRVPNMPAIAQNAERKGARPIVETLALSGGGTDGAFGAGVLAGWTMRGDRPEFEIVTGVSAGAIIAPFAYLGPEYDNVLREIWTAYNAQDVVKAQILPGLFGGSALADTTPLAGLIAKYADAELMAKVAQQYARGRMLFVLTTNLDAQRPVVWNLGEIAAHGTPRALELFRQVILASAAIPGAFPPVRIDVEADGKHYEELHVDGGTTREVFVLPVQAPFTAFDGLYPAPPIRRIYIIKNGKVSPETEVVQPTTLAIASRAIATLIKSQNWGELYRIHRLAIDAKADFNMIAVPGDTDFKTTQYYDPEYQKSLYALGVELGRTQSSWMKAPPGQTITTR